MSCKKEECEEGCGCCEVTDIRKIEDIFKDKPKHQEIYAVKSIITETEKTKAIIEKNKEIIIAANIRNAGTEEDKESLKTNIEAWINDELKRLEEKKYTSAFDETANLNAPSLEKLKEMMQDYKVSMESNGYAVRFTNVLHSSVDNEVIPQEEA